MMSGSTPPPQPIAAVGGNTVEAAVTTSKEQAQQEVRPRGRKSKFKLGEMLTREDQVEGLHLAKEKLLPGEEGCGVGGARGGRQLAGMQIMLSGWDSAQDVPVFSHRTHPSCGPGQREGIARACSSSTRSTRCTWSSRSTGGDGSTSSLVCVWR